jgi:lipopolysaccharide export LptBFGC system permease protein LptF
VSVYSLTLMLVALAVAWYSKNDGAIQILIGAIVANGTTVVNFYMGSSRSSQKKDETIAAQLPSAPAAGGDGK